MFQPSAYQQGIFDWMRDGTGHAIVNAVAGSGKSTTIEHGARESIPQWERILQVVFNRHIKESASLRMPQHCEVVTFNSFGWRVCRYNVRGVTLKPNKVDILLRKRVNPEFEKARYQRLKPPILRMVGLLRALKEPNIDAWMEHAQLYGVEFGDLKPNDYFEDTLREVYDATINWLDVMDYDDQVFQPVFRGWSIPQYSWGLLDEVQDANPCNIELALRMAETGRLLMVGDPDQSIYLFRGAHPDAMATLTRALGAKELPLSVCYRCPDSVIECAREEVPRIEAPTPNPNGVGEVRGWKSEDILTTDLFVRGVESGDMVLCRTTAPLIKRCLEQLRRGKKAYVKGRDLINQIIDLIETIHGNPAELEDQVYRYKKFRQRPRRDIEEFKDRLLAYKSDRIRQLTAAGRDAELLALEDRCEAIEMFANEADFTGQIICRVEEITSDEAQEGIAFMTGHKAKGLEAKRVWILRPDLCPHPKAKSDVQLRQERNLRYVMKTRSRGFLGFVQKEKDEK